jgi:hypothetical protein
MTSSFLRSNFTCTRILDNSVYEAKGLNPVDIAATYRADHVLLQRENDIKFPNATREDYFLPVGISMGVHTLNFKIKSSLVVPPLSADRILLDQADIAVAFYRVVI